MYINSKKNRQKSKAKIRKDKKFPNIQTSFFFLLFSFFFSKNANAQCAMCRAALQSEETGVQAEAVNDGIMYLMVIPYVLVGILGFAIYKLYLQKKKV